MKITKAHVGKLVTPRRWLKENNRGHIKITAVGELLFLGAVVDSQHAIWEETFIKKGYATDGDWIFWRAKNQKQRPVRKGE